MELIDIEEVQAAPKTELAPIERAALALDSTNTEKYLRDLATKYLHIKEVKDKAGREQAHRARMECVRARTTVGKSSKTAREDATKFSKACITEEGRLVAIILPEEERLQKICDDWDAEEARIKAEAEARERARVLAITERIAAIKSYVVMANNCRTSERVAELQTKLAGVVLVDFEEFADEAAQAHAMATEHLASVHADRLAQEAEAARIKAEQEAEAARMKAEREELARQRAEAQAEAKRVADEARAQAAAAEAKVRAAAEAMAAERAELERMRAEIEAKSKPAEQPLGNVSAPTSGATSQQIADSEPVACASGEEVTEKPEATRAPVASAIVLAVAEFWHTDNKTAARWITERTAEIATLKG